MMVSMRVSSVASSQGKQPVSWKILIIAVELSRRRQQKQRYRHLAWKIVRVPAVVLSRRQHCWLR